ncbi:unnamed protein product [Prorocentrum cordatum]|uniref:Uncharacterized protein n=1 Tax=Prorocentrum cordatum TaxID=2364126 RepID=A0ABN9T548_9DINO|nr:unnamed protein product [Polarella glacialis]
MQGDGCWAAVPCLPDGWAWACWWGPARLVTAPVAPAPGVRLGGASGGARAGAAPAAPAEAAAAAVGGACGAAGAAAGCASGAVAAAASGAPGAEEPGAGLGAGIGPPRGPLRGADVGAATPPAPAQPEPWTRSLRQGSPGGEAWQQPRRYAPRQRRQGAGAWQGIGGLGQWAAFAESDASRPGPCSRGDVQGSSPAPASKGQPPAPGRGSCPPSSEEDSSDSSSGYSDSGASGSAPGCFGSDGSGCSGSDGTGCSDSDGSALSASGRVSSGSDGAPGCGAEGDGPSGVIDIGRCQLRRAGALAWRARAARPPALHEGDGSEAASPPSVGTSAAAAGALVPAPPTRAEGDGVERDGISREDFVQELRDGLASSGWAAARALAPALRVAIRGLGFREACARLEEAASAIPDALGRRRVVERVLEAAERPRRARRSPPGRRRRGGSGPPAHGAAGVDATRRLCKLPAAELARELRAGAEAFRAFPELAAEAAQLAAAAEGDPAVDGPAAALGPAEPSQEAGGARGADPAELNLESGGLRGAEFASSFDDLPDPAELNLESGGVRGAEFASSFDDLPDGDDLPGVPPLLVHVRAAHHLPGRPQLGEHGTLPLAAVSAAAGACSVLLALRNSGAGEPPAAGPPATSGPFVAPPAPLEDIGAQQAREIRARRLGISPGDFILERYDIAGPEVWHERMVLIASPYRTDLTILTPDGDCYEEQLFAAGTPGADIAAWLPSVGGAMGAGNPATGAAHIHRFRAVPAPATCDALRTATEGRLGFPPGPRAVPNLAGRAGVGAPGVGAGAAGAGAPAAGAAVVAPAAAPPAAAPGAALGAGLAAGAAAGVAPAAGGVLVAPPLVPAAAAAAPAPAAPIAAAAPAAPAAGVGAAPPVPPMLAAAAAAGLGAGGAPPPAALAAVPGAGAAAAVAPAAPAAPTDVRILSVSYDMLGQRHRAFRGAVLAMVEHAWPDWPVKGPRARRWVLRFMETNGGAPLGRRARWRTEARLHALEFGVAEHERACRLLEFMTIYDQLNVVDLASGELLAHIVQLHEERCRERLAPETKGDNLDTHLILGCDLVRGNICVSPQLAEHLKEELTKEWAERALATKGKKVNKKGHQYDDGFVAARSRAVASVTCSRCRLFQLHPRGLDAAGLGKPFAGAMAPAKGVSGA